MNSSSLIWKLTMISICTKGLSSTARLRGSLVAVMMFGLAFLTATSARGATTPVVSWSNPSAIVYGTLLSATQLNATANVAGTFVYNPALGSLLTVGTQTLHVTFTPTDATNFTTATATASITVTRAPLTIAAGNATKLFGNANPVFLGTVIGVVPTDAITVTFTSSATAATPAGTYGPSSLEAITPTVLDFGTRLGNYTVTSTKGTLTVTPLGTVPQTITGFASFPAHTFHDAPFVITGVTGGGSGNAIIFTSSNPAVATVSGTTVTIIGAGTAVITATQAGNATYAHATPVPQTLTITSDTQVQVESSRKCGMGSGLAAMLLTLLLGFRCVGRTRRV